MSFLLVDLLCSMGVISMRNAMKVGFLQSDKIRNKLDLIWLYLAETSNSIRSKRLRLKRGYSRGRRIRGPVTSTIVLT